MGVLPVGFAELRKLRKFRFKRFDAIGNERRQEILGPVLAESVDGTIPEFLREILGIEIHSTEAIDLKINPTVHFDHDRATRCGNEKTGQFV
jgi:hypothetical protein